MSVFVTRITEVKRGLSYKITLKDYMGTAYIGFLHKPWTWSLNMALDELSEDIADYLYGSSG